MLVSVEARAENCHLVPVDERTFNIPSMKPGWPGIASTFFASENLSSEKLGEVIDYVGGSQSLNFPPREADDVSLTIQRISGWPTQDPALRAHVEVAAIDVTVAYYKNLGWSVTSVENENYGWDLEARFNGRLLRIEVKGRGSVGSIEITPNEYNAMHAEQTRMSYRLAIVHDAMTPAPKLIIFEFAPASEAWIGPNGMPLNLTLRTGATAAF
jgi:hypothetical protein